MRPTTTEAAAEYDGYAPFYDDINPSEPRPDLDFYVRFAGAPARSALDVACGTGAFAVGLAGAGRRRGRSPGDFAVVGLDRSIEMLRRAKAKAEAQGLANVHWLAADMRDFALARRFDLIVCTRNSVQHLLGDRDLVFFLERAAAHLEPGGRLAFDAFNPNLDVLLKPKREKFVKRIYSRELRRPVDVFQDTAYRAAAQVYTVTYRYLESEGQNHGGEIRRTRLIMRQYFPAELDALVASSGLRIDEKFGTYAGEPFAPHHDKQIVVCRLAAT